MSAQGEQPAHQALEEAPARLWHVCQRRYDDGRADELLQAQMVPVPIGEATELLRAWRLEDAAIGWYADLWLAPAA